MDANSVTAGATVVIAVTGAVYAIFTWGLWRETRQQAKTASKLAETASRQTEVARQTLEAAHRPHLSMDLYADAGTGQAALNCASVIHNHGTVPATVIRAVAEGRWEGQVHSKGAQLNPKQVPAQLCIFPGCTGELTWGILNPSSAPWPVSGFLRITVEIQYRGAFADRTYTTRVEVSYPRPEGSIGQRATASMQVVRAEAD